MNFRRAILSKDEIDQKEISLMLRLTLEIEIDSRRIQLPNIIWVNHIENQFISLYGFQMPVTNRLLGDGPIIKNKWSND